MQKNKPNRATYDLSKNGFDLFLWQIIVKWYTLKKSFIAINLSYKNMASRQTS